MVMEIDTNISINEAIDFLKNHPKPSDPEVFLLISVLGKMINFSTSLSPLLPKGRIIIGTGEDILKPPYPHEKI